MLTRRVLLAAAAVSLVSRAGLAAPPDVPPPRARPLPSPVPDDAPGLSGGDNFSVSPVPDSLAQALDLDAGRPISELEQRLVGDIPHGWSFTRGTTPPAIRSLWLVSEHTGDEMRIPFWRDGQLLLKGYSRLCWMFRDWRQERMTRIDPRLLHLLWAVQSGIRFQRPLRLTSGYRTRETNDMLRRASEGVAVNSFHIRGMAADVAIPGMPPSELAELAARFRIGGIGLYPGFCHLDCGPVRSWNG